MTEFAEKDLNQIIESIWESMLGLWVMPHTGALPAEGQGSFIVSRAQITGYVQITGTWEVTVLLKFSEVLARRITSTMFDLAAEAIAPEDVVDAVGELTNMISGSFKSLLPGVCALSMPVVGADVVDDDVDGPAGGVAHPFVFVCEGEPFVVTLVMPQALHFDNEATVPASYGGDGAPPSA